MVACTSFFSHLNRRGQHSGTLTSSAGSDAAY